MNTVDVFTAKQNLTKFLNENPQLKPMQAQLDQLLKATPTQAGRMVLLAKLMSKCLADIKLNEYRIQVLCKDLTKRLKELTLIDT